MRFTYRELKEFVASLTEEQLDQEVQILPNNPTPDPTLLEPVIGIDTIEHYEAEDTRSAVDFQHHPEQVVLLSDYCPFDKEGNSYFVMEEDGMMRGNKTGKLYPFGKKDRHENS